MSVQKTLQSSPRTKGFTLIEMIVVIAIIAVVSTLVLFNSTKLNSAILVSNTAYEIGLIVRESQVAGLGVKASGDGQFASSHGVHFDIATPNTIIMFADKNRNGMYDQFSNEMTQEYAINNSRSGSILGFCKESDLSVTGITRNSCTNVNTQSTLDIVFTRPNPEAFFKTRSLVSGASVVEHIGAVVINVGFAGDICRSVNIEKTGAVEINAEYCTPASLTGNNLEGSI